MIPWLILSALLAFIGLLSTLSLADYLHGSQNAGKARVAAILAIAIHIAALVCAFLAGAP